MNQNIPDDPLNCYVIIEFEGPFGPTQQTSKLMRPSEAAMTAAHHQREMDTHQMISTSILKVEVIRLPDPVKGLKP